MKKTIIILVSLTLFFAIFYVNTDAKASSTLIYISPAGADKNVEEQFNLDVVVKPDDNKVCAAEGKINLNNLSCLDISLPDGVMSQTPPTCSSTHFLIGIPGCATQDKTLFSVTLKGINPGQGLVNFSEVEVIGQGNSLSNNSVGGTYNIKSTCTCAVWSPWVGIGCGQKGCAADKMTQTRSRTCSPAGCAVKIENGCFDSSSCVASTVNNGEKTMPESPIVEENTNQPQQSQQENLLKIKGSASLLSAIGGTLSSPTAVVIIVLLCLFVIYWIARKFFPKNK